MKPIPRSIHLRLIIECFGVPIILFTLAAASLFYYLYQKDYKQLILLHENSPQLTGKVTERWDELYDKNDNISLYGYTYAFRSPAGEYISGKAYGKPYYNIGQDIKIIYNAEQAHINKPVGLETSRVAKFPLIFAVLFFIPGIVFLFMLRQSYFEQIALLRKRAFDGVKLIDLLDEWQDIDGFTHYTLLFRSYISKLTFKIDATEAQDFQLGAKYLIAYQKDKPLNFILLYGKADYIQRFLLDEFKKEELSKTEQTPA